MSRFLANVRLEGEVGPGLLQLGVLAFLLCVALTWVTRHVALRLNVVAVPKADRWHRSRIPLLGGVAIALTVSVAALAIPVRDPHLWLLLGGGLALVIVGLIDDVRPLRPQSKFVAQILVAATMAALGLQLRLTDVPVLDLFITLFWIVGITNAFNLLDNMDGLAAGVAAIAAAFRLVLFVADGNLEAAAFCSVFLGALAGFLVFNFNPASIFMGDTGSLFVGFIVSAVTLVGTWPYSRGIAAILLFPVLTLLVPIFDTALVSVARTLAGRSIATGGRDHTSHRLVALGLSEREAVLLLYMVAILSGSIGFFSYVYGLSYGAAGVALLIIALGLFGVFLGRLKIYPERDLTLSQDTRWVSVIAEFRYKRQVATVLMDLVLISVAYYAAYLLRFEGTFLDEQPRLIESMPVVLACQLLAFALFRVYQGVWRYTSLRDLIRLAQAATVGTVAAVMVLLFAVRFEGYSRAVFVLDWLLLIVLVSGSRLSFRALAEILRPRGDEADHVLIYGAGDGGVMVLRELVNNHDLRRRAVAFLDDDRSKHRTRILGVPVVGGPECLEDTINGHRIVEVIVSSPKISPERFVEVAERCEALGVSCVRASIRWE
jgi:UDP-GlcNAc:undecaprenyl-phosphate GlcNAc-1-phosphate transferase